MGELNHMKPSGKTTTEYKPFLTIYCQAQQTDILDFPTNWTQDFCGFNLRRVDRH